MTGLIHVKVTAPGLGMWGIKILESLRILIKILSLVHYHGGLISDDYVIKIIINVLPGTSLASESGPGPGWLRVLDHKDPDDRPRALAWELGARPGPDCEAEPARVTAPTLSLLIISEKIGGNVLDLHRLQESQEAPCRSHNNSPSGLTLIQATPKYQQQLFERDSCCDLWHVTWHVCWWELCHVSRDRVAWQSDPLSWHELWFPS